MQHLRKQSSLPVSLAFCCLLCRLCLKSRSPPRLQKDPSPPSQLSVCRRCGGCGAASRLHRLRVCRRAPHLLVNCIEVAADQLPLLLQLSTTHSDRRIKCHCHFSFLQLTGSLLLQSSISAFSLPWHRIKASGSMSRCLITATEHDIAPPQHCRLRHLSCSPH